jgi:hypothetical protein
VKLSAEEAVPFDCIPWKIQLLQAEQVREIGGARDVEGSGKGVGTEKGHREEAKREER